MMRSLSAIALFAALACRTPGEVSCEEPLMGRMAVFAGSELTAGHAAPETRVACRDEPELHSTLVGALKALPPDLLPEKVTVHLDPRPASLMGHPTIEFHPPSRSLLLARRAASELDHGVLLHELAHVSAAGARPGQPLSSRLHRAIEEGVADFVAASLQRSARVGSAKAGEVRDLERPPRVGANEFARLALGAPFPEHAFGHALAAELWQARPRPDPGSVLACLKDGRPWPEAPDTPRALLEEVLSRCREPGRAALLAALRRVVPSELFPE